MYSMVDLDNQLGGLVAWGQHSANLAVPLWGLTWHPSTSSQRRVGPKDLYGLVHEGRRDLLISAGALSTVGCLGSRSSRDHLVSTAQFLLMGTVEKRGLLPRVESCLCWLSSVTKHTLMLHNPTAVVFGLSSSWARACALGLEVRWSWIRQELMSVSHSC